MQRWVGMDHEQFQLLSYGGRDRGQKVRACPRGPASKTVTLGLFHTLMDLIHSRSWLLTEQVVGRGPSRGVARCLDMDAPWFHLPQSQPRSVVMVWQPQARGKQMERGLAGVWAVVTDFGCGHQVQAQLEEGPLRLGSTEGVQEQPELGGLLWTTRARPWVGHC